MEVWIREQKVLRQSRVGNIVAGCLHSASATGVMKAGAAVGIKIDQILLNDTLGTMASIGFEIIGMPAVQTKLTVA